MLNLVVPLLLWSIGVVFVRGSPSSSALVANITSDATTCANACEMICKTESNACNCGTASQQTMLACAACGASVGKTKEMQTWLDMIVIVCTEAGITIGPLVVPTTATTSASSSSAQTTVEVTPASISPTETATARAHNEIGLIVGVAFGVVAGSMMAALLIWFLCIRRKRSLTLDLSDGEGPYEGKPELEIGSYAPSHSPATDIKSSSWASYSAASSYRPLGSIASSAHDDRMDHVPLLDVSRRATRHTPTESTPTSAGDHLQSPVSVLSDGRTWTSADHDSELSDDGRPFVAAKKAPRRPVLSTRIPAADDPAADLASGQELDRIATQIASMLSTPAPPLPPVYDGALRM